MYGFIRKSYPIITMLAKQNERKMHQLKKSACGLIEGNFVNTRVLLGLFMQNRQQGCLRGCRHTCQARAGEIFPPFKVCKYVVRVSPQ